MNTVSNPSLYNEAFMRYHTMYNDNVRYLSEEDKVRANKWLSQLVRRSSTVPEMKQRNGVMKELVKQMQAGTLTAPFDIDPTLLNFESMQPLSIMTAHTVLPENFKRPQIMSQSPDEGTFLESQPFPKCGAFCYVAVVTRPTNN